MTPTNRAVLALSVSIGVALSSLHAGNGTYNTPGTGSWDTPTNWLGDTVGDIADGVNATATFSWAGISTETATVSVDTARTIGNINATSGVSHAITINGPQTLTLDTDTGTAPTITAGMAARILIINATLAGNKGVILNVTTGLGMELGGANTYTGLTRIDAGIIDVKNNSAFGSTTGATTVVSGASIRMNNGMTVTGETLNLSGSGGASNLGAIHTANNAVAEWTGNINLDSSVRIGAQGASSVLTLSGVISDGGVARGLAISHSNDAVAQGTVILSGASTYLGTTTIFRGTLKLDGGNDRLPTSTLLILGQTNTNSTFDLNGRSQQIIGLSNSVAGASTRTVTNTSGTASVLTLNVTAAQSFLGDADDTTLISGKLSIVKNGSFSQTLAKTNSYTGNTFINAGTLILADDATQTFYIGANGVNNTMSGTGTLTLNGDFIFDLTSAVLTASNSWNIVNVGTLSESFNSTFTVQGFTETGLNTGVWVNNIHSNLTFTESTGLLMVIPEPSSAALIFGAIGMTVLVRRKKIRLALS